MKTAKIKISEEDFIKKLFKKSEIKNISPAGYKFIQRNKIVVYVPDAFTDKVAEAMFKAGAGKIGNYDKCSFRINGTGTYKPNKNAKPHSGEKNKLSVVPETRLEVECDSDDMYKVLDSMLAAHPYEETAYEIYDFKKRINETDGSIVELKKPVQLSEILKRLNTRFEENETVTMKIKKAAVFCKGNNADMESIRAKGVECLFKLEKNKIQIIKI